jgi:hypothetical protein
MVSSDTLDLRLRRGDNQAMPNATAKASPAYIKMLFTKISFDGISRFN